MEQYNVLVLMQKDKETGFVLDTINSYTIYEGMGLVTKVFAEEVETEIMVNLYLTTKDVEDWEFEALFDYYDTGIYKGLVVGVEEIDDDYNPTWLLKFKYNENRQEMEAYINQIIGLHIEELERAIEEIKDVADEYK